MTEDFINFTHNFIYPHECEYAHGFYGKLDHVVWENVSGDPGGPTKFGIDLASHKSLGINGIKNLSIQEADEIYWQEWIKYGCDKIDGDLKFAYSNCCTNCGVGRAKKLLGGCKTASNFLDKQENFYLSLVKGNKKYQKFLKGWLTRTKDLRVFLKLV